MGPVAYRAGARVRNQIICALVGTGAGAGRSGFSLLNNKGSYNARYPTLADRYPNSDHYPAMAFWRASLIAGS
jgi:hypothetical protein